MKSLLYNPDNGVTRNFMPHLWMFLLQALTPPGHEVIMIDGNAKAMSDEKIVSFVQENNIGLAAEIVPDIGGCGVTQPNGNVASPASAQNSEK